MTDIDLDAIRARAEAATAGPWRRYETMQADTYVLDRRGLLGGGIICGATYERDNAEFIAHARADVPVLIAEVERLRTAVAGIEEALIQAAFMQIALDQCLTVLPVGEWGSTTRAHVPGHWREAATRRAQPYILTVAEVIARADA